MDEKRQSDLYFNAPDRDFAKTDEALRIRTEKGKNFLTYKGPKIDRHTKSRREIEIEIRAKKKKFMRELLELLGYRKVAKVNKTRRTFKLDELTISLDRIEQLGTFIEVEATAEAKDFKKKQKQITDLLEKLDLDISKSIRESYLELLLAKRG